MQLPVAIHAALCKILHAVLAMVLYIAWHAYVMLHGMLHGTVHGTVHGTLHGKQHTKQHGMQHGTLCGMLHGMLHGTLHGTLHGMLHGTPSCPSAPLRHEYAATDLRSQPALCIGSISATVSALYRALSEFQTGLFQRHRVTMRCSSGRSLLDHSTSDAAIGICQTHVRALSFLDTVPTHTTTSAARRAFCDPYRCQALYRRRQRPPTACLAHGHKRAGTLFERLDDRIPIGQWHVPQHMHAHTPMHMSVHMCTHIDRHSGNTHCASAADRALSI